MTHWKLKTIAAATLAAFCAAPALANDAAPQNATTGSVADEAENLRRQLAAQMAINAQLRQRVEALEQRLAAETKTEGPVVVGLDKSLRPASPLESSEPTSAIEEALVSRGLVLLPTGTIRLTPGFSWEHSAQGGVVRDAYTGSLALEAGLPWGMAASVQVPYSWLDYEMGKNQGVGDVSLSLAKRLNNETASMPSFVARLGYTHDTGKDPHGLPAVGSGFRSYSMGLSAVKRFEPLALYGSVSYSKTPGRHMTLRDQNGAERFRGRIEPGDGYGLGMGVSLAATPDISLETGLSLSFLNKTFFRPDAGNAFQAPRSTVGYFNLGMGMVLSRNLFLSVSAAAGVTQNASDFVLSVALPYRF